MRLHSVYIVQCIRCGKHHESHEPVIRCDCGRELVIEWRAKVEAAPPERTITERYERGGV